MKTVRLTAWLNWSNPDLLSNSAVREKANASETRQTGRHGAEKRQLLFAATQGRAEGTSMCAGYRHGSKGI